MQAAHFSAKLFFHLLLLFLAHKTMTHAIEHNFVNGSKREMERFKQRVHIIVERGMEERRVIGIDREGHAGSVEARQGMLCQAGIDAQTDIAMWADL